MLDRRRFVGEFEPLQGSGVVLGLCLLSDGNSKFSLNDVDETVFVRRRSRVRGLDGLCFLACCAGFIGEGDR